MLNLTFILLAVLLLLLSSHFAFHLYKSLTSPLRAIPGPFWSRFTKLWYLNRVRKGHFEKENIHLHEKYGSIVRLAPDMYSISDISAVKTVYGTGSRFPKSDWYLGWKHPSPDSWTLFSDRNVRRHGLYFFFFPLVCFCDILTHRPAETRKRFSSLYSMSSLVNYEEFVDHCADLFAARLTGFSETRETFDLHHWFQCYAFDVIGEMTFGERFGELHSCYSSCIQITMGKKLNNIIWLLWQCRIPRQRRRHPRHHRSHRKINNLQHPCGNLLKMASPVV